MKTSRTYAAIPPGETIKEQLELRQMTQKEFAIRMNLSEKHISHLINGLVELTPDVAFRLEMVLGLPASFWNQLEATYRENLAKVDEENSIDSDIEIMEKIPYSELVRNGWIRPATSKFEKVITLRQYFEVTSLSIIDDQKINKIACRRKSDSEKSHYSLLAWAQQAKLVARNRDVGKIDIRGLKEHIPEIRSMSKYTPDVFCGDLITLLSKYGISLVFLPHIGGSFLHGATFVDGKKIVIGLTVRGKYADIFWFSLFHELGHILEGHVFQEDGTTKSDEDDADAFARDILIPPSDYDHLRSIDCYSINELLQEANRIGVDVGILIGRLHNEEIIPHNALNSYRTKYTIS